MILKFGRVHDACPDCGAEILVGPMEQFMQSLKASGFGGMAPVMVHALPLCETAQDRADSAWKEIRTRAEDDMENAKQQEREAAQAQRERRASKPQTQSRK